VIRTDSRLEFNWHYCNISADLTGYFCCGFEFSFLVGRWDEDYNITG